MEDTTTWTQWTFRCEECGNLCRASVESIAIAHEREPEEMHHPRDIARDFVICLSCIGVGGDIEVDGERDEDDVVRNLAREFASRINLALTASQLATVRARNLSAEYGSACATHDFIDSNEEMADAYRHVTGYDIDVSSDRDTARVNRAWDIARAGGFFAHNR